MEAHIPAPGESEESGAALYMALDGGVGELQGFPRNVSLADYTLKNVGQRIWDGNIPFGTWTPWLLS